MDVFKLNFNSLTMHTQIYVLIPHPALNFLSFADFLEFAQRLNTRVDALLRKLSREQPYSGALCDIEEICDNYIVTLLESMHSNLYIFSMFVDQQEDRFEPSPIPEGILRHIILPKKVVICPKVVKHCSSTEDRRKACKSTADTSTAHI